MRKRTHARRTHAPALIEPLEPRQLLSAGPRIMENLGRGVVATRTGTNSVFVSWRLLALDPGNVGFNLYRSTNGAAPIKINGSVLTGGTNFTDTSANTSRNYAYSVRPVIGGVEQAPSAPYTLAANTPSQPLFSIPLRNITGTASDYYIQHTWIGDLDGDGEYDFVVARLPTIPDMPDIVEAYKRDGTWLWAVNMGPNSFNKNNIEPGSSTISVGHWDGVTVYDLDSDGKAEVAIRTANGVLFGNSSTLSFPANNNIQFISVLDGMTGVERSRIQIPTDYLADGPMPAQMGVGYLDGVRPSLVARLKNRIGNGGFNMMVLAYDFNGTSITQKWKWTRGNANISDGHQIRIFDVDQDGRDEVVDIGFVLNGNGTLKYSMTPQGVVHGDRFHIGDLDPDRPGLEGYAIQQNNPSGLLEYYYDAATGQLIHQHFAASGTADVGRGVVADIDPAHRGYEYWSFSGIYNSKTPVPGQPPVETKLTNDPNRPWPNFRIWWDGDLLSENLNETKVENWNPATQNVSRQLSAHNFGATDTWRSAPTHYGDIIGDWREEIIFEKWDHTELLIFTTQAASSTRLYTLAQNPAYRNAMTVKGYLQSHMVDYYLGDGMTTPPTPNIVYVDTIAPTVVGFHFDYTTNPNALRFTFSEDVQSSLSAADLVIAGPGGADVSVSGFSYDPNTRTATFQLPMPLVNGRYTAAFAAGAVTDYQGNPLAGSLSFSFFALGGDANHDGVVDIADLSTLAANWQGSGKAFAQGDFTYDGLVDHQDLAILAGNWQATPDGPATAAAPMPAIAGITAPSPEPVARRSVSAVFRNPRSADKPIDLVATRDDQDL